MVNHSAINQELLVLLFFFHLLDQLFGLLSNHRIFFLVFYHVVLHLSYYVLLLSDLILEHAYFAQLFNLVVHVGNLLLQLEVFELLLLLQMAHLSDFLFVLRGKGSHGSVQILDRLLRLFEVLVFQAHLLGHVREVGLNLVELLADLVLLFYGHLQLLQLFPVPLDIVFEILDFHAEALVFIVQYFHLVSFLVSEDFVLDLFLNRFVQLMRHLGQLLIHLFLDVCGQSFSLLLVHLSLLHVMIAFRKLGVHLRQFVPVLTLGHIQLFHVEVKLIKVLELILEQAEEVLVRHLPFKTLEKAGFDPRVRIVHGLLFVLRHCLLVESLA